MNKKQRVPEDKEKCIKNEAHKKTLTFGDSSILSIPKEITYSSNYFLRSTIKDSDNKKVKNPAPEKLQKIDDKYESNKDSAPINKLNLSYISS